MSLADNTMSCIIDAFSKVECEDIRVDKVILEREKFYEIATSRNFLNFFSTGGDQNDRILGMLWGAKLEIGEKSKVCGEKGFIPFSRRKIPDIYIERPDPTLRYEIGIDWSLSPEIEFKYKLEDIRRRIRSNLTIIVKSRSDIIYKYSKSEWNAIETLREMISEKEWRNYIKYGFLLVKGSSGKVYQIPRKNAHTRVWLNGRIVEEICVRIKDRDIPPTDNVIAFKVLIESDEESFKKLGNVYKNAA